MTITNKSICVIGLGYIGLPTASLLGMQWYSKIVTEVELILTDEKVYTAMSQAHNPYGDGFAASRITEALSKLNT